MTDSVCSSSDLLSKLSMLEKRSTYEERALSDGFSGWKTVRQLGAGSHGRCYLMRKPDGSHVVHKRVPVSHMKPAEQEAAEREVNILATFSHPNIIRYDHAFVRQGQLNIVMEHASGGDLANHLRSLVDAGERPSIAQSLDWFVQLLLALECVHACRVLHRDVALKNVFLADGGVLKLGDFGVARVLASTQDMAQTRVGTPCYIAPERCDGRAYSYASDVWSVGCLLYELLSTRPAFAGETLPELTRRILAGDYDAWSMEDLAVVPHELRDLVRSMLEVEPSARPSIRAVLERPLVQPSLSRHAAVRESYNPSEHQQPKPIAKPDIPLVGYEGASKTKFSERPVFVEGGCRIVEEGAISSHDAKLIAQRNRRQQQLAERKGSSGGASAAGLPPTNFEKVQNFGSAGVVGFLVQSGATGGASYGCVPGCAPTMAPTMAPTPAPAVPTAPPAPPPTTTDNASRSGALDHSYRPSGWKW